MSSGFSVVCACRPFFNRASITVFLLKPDASPVASSDPGNKKLNPKRMSYIPHNSGSALSRVRYLEDIVDCKKKPQRTKWATVLRDKVGLMKFALALKQGKFRQTRETLQDPRGNWLSSNSYGHIHHPIHGPRANQWLARCILREIYKCAAYPVWDDVTDIEASSDASYVFDIEASSDASYLIL